MSVKFASLMVAVSLATVAMAAPGAQAGLEPAVQPSC